MSAAGTHTKDGEWNGGEHRGEAGWHKKRERRGKKKKTGRRWESVLGKSDITRRSLRNEIYSVMFLSDSNQFGQKVALQVKMYLKL